MTRRDISLAEALDLTLESLRPLPAISVPVWESTGLALAEDVTARVDSPSLTASSKDGFALRGADSEGASEDHPVRLRLGGEVVAGPAAYAVPEVAAGVAVKVTTGAPLPPGADAVVAAEFADEVGDDVVLRRDARPGRNVFRRGSDVAAGARLAPAGTPIAPAMTGLLAAGGVTHVQVVPRPEVAVLGTGDEVVAPGSPLAPGQLFASNLVTLRSWLRRFHMESRFDVVPDDSEAIAGAVRSLLSKSDVVLTSGGAWKSGRDLSPAVVEALGGRLVFHRVRLAPGKAAALGVLDDGVIFCLPGGPPSNEMAFLQLALPGLLRMAGLPPRPFPVARARLQTRVRSNHSDPSWTYFFQGRLHQGTAGLEVEPLRWRSRLEAQAHADSLVRLADGEVRAEAGVEVSVQILSERGPS